MWIDHKAAAVKSYFCLFIFLVRRGAHEYSYWLNELQESFKYHGMKATFYLPQELGIFNTMPCYNCLHLELTLSGFFQK